MLQVPPTRLYLFMYETDSKQLSYIMASSKLCSEFGQIYSKSIKITASSLVVYNSKKYSRERTTENSCVRLDIIAHLRILWCGNPKLNDVAQNNAKSTT